MSSKKSAICKVEKCDRLSHAHGYCAAHAARYRRQGTPQPDVAIGTGQGEPGRWLRDLISGSKTDSCIIWPFSRSVYGYANYWLDGKSIHAHRVVLTLYRGEAPTPKHQCAHICGKGHLGCVNPSHLRWATHQENQVDRLIHGTDCRGEKNPASKLTDKDVIDIYHDARSQRTIARVFGISQPTVGKIKCGKSWSWLDKG